MSERTEDVPVEQQSGRQQFSDFLSLSKQYIKLLRFENKLSAEKIIALNQLPTTKVEVNYSVDKLEDDLYEIPLTVEATGLSDNQELFKAELTYAGVFKVIKEDQRILPVLFLVECPHLLFPFARQIICTTVREAGYPSIFINPIDFASIYLKKAEELKNKTEKK